MSSTRRPRRASKSPTPDASAGGCGFQARGTARFDGVEEWKGRHFRLDFQNEFLMAERDGEIVCTTPDLITLLEAESGAPVTADSLRYGLRLVALAFPCNPQWTTPAGIALVGPRYFGYDTDYVPYVSG